MHYCNENFPPALNQNEMDPLIKKIKVLFLLPSLKKESPVMGTLAIAKNISNHQYDITFACLDKISNNSLFIYEELKHHKINVRFLNMTGWFGLIKFNIAKNFLKEGMFDIIHSYGIRPDFLNCLLNKNAVSISTVREIINVGYRMRYGTVLSSVFSFFHLQALKRMDFIIAISKAIEKNLVRNKISEFKVENIPNCIDLLWKERHSKQNLPTNHNMDQNRINIGYIGSFIKIKRVDFILNAYAKIVKLYPELNMQLHLVGDGPLRNSLIEMINDLNIMDQTVLHGYIFDVASIMYKMDVVVLASVSEGIPRALMEAMSMGITCIGPDIDGVNELIQNNSTGYLFDPGSENDLFNKLESVVVRNKYLDPFIIQNHIENNFNAAKAAASWTNLYDKLVKK